MKKIFLGIIAIFVVVAVVACGELVHPNPPQERLVEWLELDPELEFTTEAVTINFWHRKGVDNNNLLMNQWIPAFNALFPNITVNTNRISGNYDQLQAAITQEIQFGRLATYPDVMESYPDHVLSYIPVVSRTFALPTALNNFITHPKFGMESDLWLDFFEKFRAEAQYDNSATLTSTRPEDWNEEFQIGGTVMSLPYLKSTEVLIYDRALFEARNFSVPTTWEELGVVGQQMLDANLRTTTVRGNAASVDRRMLALGYDSSANFFITGSLQYGAPFTALDEDNRGQILFNNEQSMSMMSFFGDLAARGILTTRVLEFGAVGGAFLSNAFRAGQVAAYIGSSAGVRNAFDGPGTGGTTAAPLKPGDNSTEGTFAAGILPAVAPIPHFEGKAPQQIQQGPNISMFFHGDIQRAIASWLFMKFVTSAEINAQFITNHGGRSGAPGNMPSRISTLETQTWLDFRNGVYRWEDDQLDIPVADLLALVPALPDGFSGTSTPQNILDGIERFGSRLAFDTIMLSLANVDSFFVTPAFDRSSRVRGAVETLVNNIMAETVNAGGVLPPARMRQLFDAAYLASW